MKKNKVRNTKEVKRTHPVLSTRSPFATAKMSGAGVHKSKKDYDRKVQKRETRKLLKGDDDKMV